MRSRSNWPGPSRDEGIYAAVRHSKVKPPRRSVSDSLDVVSLLCDVEPIVGFQLKDSLIVRADIHCQRAIDQFMPRIE